MRKISKDNSPKKIIAKSTTALTCLLSAAVIYAGLNDANATTTSGSFTINTDVGNSCALSLSGNISFGAYVPATASRATTTLYANCTTGTIGTITITNALDSAYDEFKLVRSGGNATVSADYLWSTFSKTTFGKTAYGSDLLYLGSNSFSAAGTGSEASIGTIYGRVASGQFSRSVGAFTRAITLVVTY